MDSRPATEQDRFFKQTLTKKNDLKMNECLLPVPGKNNLIMQLPLVLTL